MVTIRERGLDTSRTSAGGLNINFENPLSVTTQTNTTSPSGGGDEVSFSYNALNEQLGKQDEFNLNSSNGRIRQQSYLAYERDLNLIKQLNEEGKLAEYLGKINYNTDTSTSWGKALNDILADAEIKRNGETLTASDLKEALEKDKNDRIKEAISDSIGNIQRSSEYKEQIEEANENYDGRLVFAGSSAASTVAWQGVKALAPKIAQKATIKVVAGGLGKAAGLALGPVGIGLSIGIPIALYAMDQWEPTKNLKDGVGDWIKDTAGDIGDSIGYHVSKMA